MASRITITSHEQHGVSSQRHVGRLLNSFFRLIIKETSHLRTTGPLWEAHKGGCMRKAFPCHDVIILLVISVTSSQCRQYCCIDSGCDRKSNFPISVCSDSSNLKNVPRSYMKLLHQLSCGGVCQIWMRFKRAKIILQNQTSRQHRL